VFASAIADAMVTTLVSLIIIIIIIIIIKSFIHCMKWGKLKLMKSA
jgi:hypothetical protein